MPEIKMLKLRVVGEQTIHCNGCERTIEFTLAQLPSVRLVRADHETQRIEIDSTHAGVEMGEVISKLDQIGYEVEHA